MNSCASCCGYQAVQEPTCEVLCIALPHPHERSLDFIYQLWQRCFYGSFDTLSKNIFPCKTFFFLILLTVIGYFLKTMKLFAMLKTQTRKYAPNSSALLRKFQTSSKLLGYEWLLNSCILRCDRDTSQPWPCLHNCRSSLGQNFLRAQKSWKVTVTNDAECWNRLPAELTEISTHAKQVSLRYVSDKGHSS